MVDTATNTVTTTISVGLNPTGVAVSPDGSRLYVTPRGVLRPGDGDRTGTNTVITTINFPAGAVIASTPSGVVVSPDGTASTSQLTAGWRRSTPPPTPRHSFSLG